MNVNNFFLGGARWTRTISSGLWDPSRYRNVSPYSGGVCQNRTDYFRAMDLQSIPLPSGPHTILKNPPRLSSGGFFDKVWYLISLYRTLAHTNIFAGKYLALIIHLRLRLANHLVRVPLVLLDIFIHCILRMSTKKLSYFKLFYRIAFYFAQESNPELFLRRKVCYRCTS